MSEYVLFNVVHVRSSLKKITIYRAYSRLYASMLQINPPLILDNFALLYEQKNLEPTEVTKNTN